METLLVFTFIFPLCTFNYLKCYTSFMLQKISAVDRYLALHDWLSTYHLFSFADYFDPDNMNFGVLRVFNDDTIDARSGFGDHGHSDMEIVTIVLDGELTHTDSMGNTGSIKAGDVQYMSAGTGVIHSEYNNSSDAVHLYQIWIMPNERRLIPTYGQKHFEEGGMKNVLHPVAAGKELGDAIKIRADATIYKSILDKEKEISYNLLGDRGMFVYVTTGVIEINDTIFEAGDQARIVDEKNLVIKAKEDAKFVALDVRVR